MNVNERLHGLTVKEKKEISGLGAVMYVME